MSLKTAFGGSKSRSQSRTSVIPRLPAVIPRIGTQQGSFLQVTPTTETSGASVGEIRAPGSNIPISNAGALTGLDLNIGLAPQIQAIRDEALAGRRELIGDISGDIETLRGIENPFIRARVAPFVEAQAQAARDASRRGVSGPLAALATNPFTRQIADQQALATSDAQGAIRAGQQQIASLLNDVSGEGQQLLVQELELLGLSQQQIRDIIASQLDRQTVTDTESKESQQRGVTQGVKDIVGSFFPTGLKCWVAREVFGPESLKWLEFRQWLEESAPRWFHDFYVRWGPQFAGWLRNKPFAKRIVRALMEGVLKNG